MIGQSRAPLAASGIVEAAAAVILGVAGLAAVAAGAAGLIDAGLATLVAATLCVACAYVLLARRLSSKEVAVVATMATLSAVGRLAFVAIPSVQPSTVLIIVSGYVFGPGAGFLIGATTALVSNIFLGQGPWTIWQMAAWGLVGASAGGLGRITRRISTLPLAAFAAAAGLAFSALMNIWFWLAFLYPHNLTTLVAAFSTSLGFDMLHAVGNAVFAVVIGPRAIAVLTKFRSRFHVVWGEAATGG